MSKRLLLLFAAAALIGGSAAAQNTGNPVQAAAAKMGVTNMKSIQYSGAGWQGMVGQNFTPLNDWPRVDLKDYTRTIDFETMSSKEEYTRSQGNNSVQGGGAGFPFLQDQRVVNYVSGNYAWTQNAQGQIIPQPDQAELRRLEIYLTPHGFLKGALASNQVTMIPRNEYGGRVTVVSYLVGNKYRVNGTINADNLVQRVQTWVPNPVVGDLYVEFVYSNYRDVGGVMMPRFHNHVDFDDGGTPNPSGGDHGFGLETVTAARVNVPDAALTVPENVRTATVPAVAVQSQMLGQGLWLIAGGSHNSVLIEFRDYVAVIEAPLNEARSLAVIAEVNRLVPNKPIRYLVNTHHHWDHLGGIRTYVHEGATVITHENNKPYYQEVLRAGTWNLEPDRFSLFPPEEWSEGYIFETVNQKYVLGDDTRTVELHTIQGLPHVTGMLVAYFPREKILVQADLFNSAATAANANSRALNNNLQRLRLDVQQIVGIHGTPATIAQFQQVVGRQ
jgi:glyoxylase-like metal-dependent hydrolase (beta-lactamase superfamily II)